VTVGAIESEGGSEDLGGEFGDGPEKDEFLRIPG